MKTILTTIATISTIIFLPGALTTLMVIGLWKTFTFHRRQS